jgi:hypothetical protein
MPCGCLERAKELAEAGVAPLVGEDYTAVDAVQWLVRRLAEKLRA